MWNSTMEAPLTDIVVLEIANWIAGPSCGALLADLGATVIKVEPPQGDAMRYVLRNPRASRGEKVGSNIDPPFNVDNRGKQSIAIKLDTLEGQRIVQDLSKSVDIIISNLLPERLQKFGLHPEKLMEENPRLIFASLTGWGLKGDEVNKMAFDTTAFFARGGVSATLSTPEHFSGPRPGQGDHQTGLALLSAILAALISRQKTNRGQLVEASLIRSATWAIASDISTALFDGLPVNPGKRSNGSVLRLPFLCKDDRWIQMMMPNPTDVKYLHRFFNAIGKAEWTESHHNYGTMGGYMKHRAEVNAAVEGIFRTKTAKEWDTVLQDAKVICAVAHNLDEVVKDKQLRANNAFVSITHPVQGKFETVNAPFNLHGSAVGPQGAAPDPGQHTTEVLQQRLHMVDVDIARLKAAGIVGYTPTPGTPLQRWMSKL
eukprot:m.1337493 g.1337493  ORF g.1337493 m.1337493 type:complete len:430 (+) comp24882_c1_seq24:150-1439(+)